MSEARFRHLLHQWLYGNLSLEEVDEFLEGLHTPVAEDLLGQSILEDLRQTQIAYWDQQAIEDDAIVDKVLRKIEEEHQEVYHVRPVLHIQRWLAAASVLLLIGLGMFWMSKNRSPQEVAKVNADKKETIVKYRNNTLKVQTIFLPDSSTVQLKPDAEINFKQDFHIQRDVVLVSGDAFFEVRKNPNAPFSVYAKGIKTTALGTAFWVESPATKLRVTVRLSHGKVSLNSIEQGFSMDEVILTPGQNCLVNKENGYVKVFGNKQRNTIPVVASNHANAAADARAVLWTNDEVRFNGAQLSNVLTQLEARYNIKIIADKNAVRNVVLTGQIYANDSLRPILKSICDMNNLAYEMKNDSVYLKKKDR